MGVKLNGYRRVPAAPSTNGGFDAGAAVVGSTCHLRHLLVPAIVPGAQNANQGLGIRAG